MKISIITATWNSGRTLSDTIKSIINQTYNNIEYIIIDGSSSDDTINIIKEYEPKFDGRLKWISEKDNGLYDAMNKGIRMATGDVIGILNSDDFYASSDVLKNIADAFTDVDAVYGDIQYVDSSNLKECVRYYSSKSFKRWKMRLGIMPAHPSFYCKREIYTKYGLFDLDFKIAADFEQLLRLIYIHRIKTRYIPMLFVTMRRGGISSSGFSSHKRIIRDHMLAYKKNGIYSNYFLEGIRYVNKLIDIYWFRSKKKLTSR